MDDCGGGRMVVGWRTGVLAAHTGCSCLVEFRARAVLYYMDWIVFSFVLDGRCLFGKLFASLHCT